MSDLTLQESRNEICLTVAHFHLKLLLFFLVTFSSFRLSLAPIRYDSLCLLLILGDCHSSLSSLFYGKA